MKFVTDLSDLRTALAGCAKVVARDALRDVLNYAHITQGALPTVIIEACDGFQMIQYIVVAGVEDEGDMIVDPKMVLASLASVPKGVNSVTLWQEPGLIWIESEGKTWKVAIPAPDIGEYINTDKVWPSYNDHERTDAYYNPKLLANIATLCQLNKTAYVHLEVPVKPTSPTVIHGQDVSSTMKIRGLVLPVKP